MSAITDSLVPPAEAPPLPRKLLVERSRPDRAFRGITSAAGLTTFLILFLIGLFLFLKGLPALRSQGLGFFTTEVWDLTRSHPRFGVAALVYWTVAISLVALATATPVAVATALFLTECAPRPVRGALTVVVDLLAAIPSVIYGVWAVLFFQQRLVGTAQWFTNHLSFIPIFASNVHIYTSSAFVAGIVVGIMILPLITSISREVFSLAPTTEREGALALGATRWDVIRRVVLPFGKGGVVGAVFLGLGRALGETIAVTLIISPIFSITPHILQAGANSIAAHITLRFGSGGALGLSGLLAAGFTLFVLTLAVNLAASAIIRRSRSGRGLEI